MNTKPCIICGATSHWRCSNNGMQAELNPPSLRRWLRRRKERIMRSIRRTIINISHPILWIRRPLVRKVGIWYHKRQNPHYGWMGFARMDCCTDCWNEATSMVRTCGFALPWLIRKVIR